jgi:hypothetical protein
VGGLLSLALISGGITLGIYVRHPFAFGLVGVIVGIVFWGIGVYKYTNIQIAVIKQ